MNYREQQLRQLIKNDYIPKSQYQQEITNLQKTNQALTILANQRKADLEQEKSGLIKLANRKITDKDVWANKLADSQAELKKVQREKASLLTIKEELASKLTTINTQLEGLLFAIDKDIIKDKWKLEVTTSLEAIKATVNQENQ